MPQRRTAASRSGSGRARPRAVGQSRRLICLCIVWFSDCGSVATLHLCPRHARASLTPRRREPGRRLPCLRRQHWAGWPGQQHRQLPLQLVELVESPERHDLVVPCRLRQPTHASGRDLVFDAAVGRDRPRNERLGPQRTGVGVSTSPSSSRRHDERRQAPISSAAPRGGCRAALQWPVLQFVSLFCSPRTTVGPSRVGTSQWQRVVEAEQPRHALQTCASNL